MASSSTVTCPDGHQSEATDWCDTCGVAIGAEPSSAAASAGATTSPPAAPVAAGPCPNCGTDHLEGEAFCEVCGLDFATGNLPAATPAAALVEEGSADPASGDPASEPAGPTWTAVVDADREWFDHNEAESGSVVEFPADAAPRTIALTGKVVTIGRRDDKRGWYPTIDLGVPVLDPSSSRKHAELHATDDGWQLVDLDSTNGTVIDGDKIAPGSPTDLPDGAVVHLGAFTRITINAPVDPGASS